MIIAKISAISFKEDGNRHTVNYAKLGNKIASYSHFQGNLHQVISSDMDGAIALLTSELRIYLSNVFSCQALKVDYKDFTFRINYESVVDSNGAAYFWNSLTGYGPEIDLSTGQKVK